MVARTAVLSLAMIAMTPVFGSIGEGPCTGFTWSMTASSDPIPERTIAALAGPSVYCWFVCSVWTENDWIRMSVPVHDSDKSFPVRDVARSILLDAVALRTTRRSPATAFEPTQLLHN